MLTYEPEQILSSSSVIKENLSVTYDDTPVSIEKVFYYPTKNLLIMNIANMDTSSCEYFVVLGNGITDTDGNVLTLNGKAALTRAADPSYGTVDVAAVYYKSGSEPIFNLIGKSDVTVMVRITNTSSFSAVKKVLIYDGEEVVGQQTVNVNADDFVEVAILISGHKFINNNANVEIL